ncbi:hypothetical protein BU26DRAFT_586322 [Trematosphaeria pertusa]|uniref:ATP-grasp domain-containing protein n=1 Tax=Trematosphaeria pertusa TaxID=390896 RepID=A0A6A6HSU7_9PLEO|nr:uncharacterized protein BU26DRAFT_586322 [Trematosphaeria pertusa]KAF2241166.1 hypothetical protein BU26DRAFT_586322 [Trematosphaeria pertusa]
MTEDFISETFLITPRESPIGPTRIDCRWRCNRDGQHFGALDLRLHLLPAAQEGAFEDATDTPLGTLFRGIWGKAQGHGLADTTEMAITVILVPRGRHGFVCRSDILHLRVGQSQFVERVIAFAGWDKHLPALPTGTDDTKCLLALLPCSPGALLLRQPHDEALQDDLTARLSFNWLLPNRPVARRVAVVSGRPFPDRKRQMYSAQGFFAAAHALGISLVVVDNVGHWLENSAYQSLRDEFVPMDMDINRLADLPQRLVAALKDKHLDGIVTFWDAYVIQTAEAAELLGLPTESSVALRQAHLKHEMRELVSQPNIQAVTIDSVERLDDPSMAETLRSLRYPLVVKPCRGGTSESVKKVTDESSMREAVRIAFKDGFPNPAIALVLLETYVDGPELDANFMLWNGEIQFLEVTDSFPCAADATDATVADPFRETVQISNSLLPPDEIEVIRSSLHRSILKLGFGSGVFHLEARMRNPSMKYQDTRGDGILDLDLGPCVAANRRGKADVFLVEINVRPPGTGGTWATLFAYGVDQGALHFLRALDDGERFAALSQPYAFPSGSAGGGGGAQYWTAQCLVPIHRDNIRVPDDLWERVYRALPDVEPYVVRAEMYAEPGTIVSIRRSVGWIGYVLLYSRTSRRHVLEMYHWLAEACIKVLDEEL